MNPRSFAIVTLYVAIAVALTVVRLVRAEDVPAEVLADLQKLTDEQLKTLEEEIDKAEARRLAQFVGKKTIANRPAQTEDDIRKVLKSDRNAMANIRKEMREDLERWRRRQPDAKEVLAVVYGWPRQALLRVWEAHYFEAAQRVHSLLEEQSDVHHKDMDPEYEQKEAELRSAFGFGTEKYNAALAAYLTSLKQREQERKGGMRKAHAEATEQLLAARRLLAGEAWRWVDIARRRGHDDEARKCTAFVYRQFAYELQSLPREVREAVLGKGNTGGGSALDRWYDLQTDRLAIYTFPILREPGEALETLRMGKALAAEPVESLKMFDDSPLPQILAKIYRIVDRQISSGAFEARRKTLERELREAEARIRRTDEEYKRATKELERQLRHLEDIEEGLDEIAAKLDQALARSRELAEAAKTEKQRKLERQMRTNEQRIAENIKSIDALKSKGVLSPSEVEVRDRLAAENVRLQQVQREVQADLDRLQTEPPEEAKRQAQLAKELDDAFWKELSRRNEAENEVSVAFAHVDGALAETFAAVQQTADVSGKLVRLGPPIEGGITDIWVWSREKMDIYYREESLSSVQKQLDALMPKLKEAKARHQMLAEAAKKRKADYEKFTKERNEAAAELEAARKKSEWAQIGLEIGEHIRRSRKGDFRRSIRKLLSGGWKIHEPDFAAHARIKSNDPALTEQLPRALTDAVQAKDWREASDRELDRFLRSATSLEELAKRLRDLDRLVSWLDTLSVEIDSQSLLDSLLNNRLNPMEITKEQLDAFLRQEAMQRFLVAQVRASITTILWQKTSRLAEEALNTFRELQQAVSKILENLDKGAGLVTMEKTDFPRDGKLEVIIGHADIERLNIEVKLGGQEPDEVGNTTIPKENPNQPGRRFVFKAEKVKGLTHDGKGGVTLEIKVGPPPDTR